MYSTKVYKAVGGDEIVVESGGKITLKAGSTLENAGDFFTSVTFDTEHFAESDGEISLATAVTDVLDTAAHGTPVANIPVVDTDLSTSADGTAIAGAVNANATAINAIIAALEAFGISLPDA